MSIADDLTAAFEPWINDELEDFLRTAGEMFEQVEELAFDPDDGDRVGWEILLDPATSPIYALQYLAQFTGERLPKDLAITNEALAREWLVDQPASRRGTVESIIRTAQRTLTGQRTVVLHTRTPDEDSIAVETLVSETPDAAVVAANLRRDAVPADIVMTHSTITGQTLNDVNAGFADLNAVNAAYPDLNAVASDVPAGTTYTRPLP